MGTKSIFNDPFYGPLLAAGEIPGEDDVPERLAEAVAIRLCQLGDSATTEECRGPVALVLLALKQGLIPGFQIAPRAAEPSIVMSGVVGSGSLKLAVNSILGPTNQARIRRRKSALKALKLFYDLEFFRLRVSRLFIRFRLVALKLILQSLKVLREIRHATVS